MSIIWEEERNEGILVGIEKGRLEGLFRSLLSMMETLNMSVEAAMNALKLTEQEKEIYRQKIEGKNRFCE